MPSDSSSGVSDDTLSSGSDSGIEAGENWSNGPSRVYHGVPVSYSSDQVNKKACTLDSLSFRLILSNPFRYFFSFSSVCDNTSIGHLEVSASLDHILFLSNFFPRLGII